MAFVGHTVTALHCHSRSRHDSVRVSAVSARTQPSSSARDERLRRSWCRGRKEEDEREGEPRDDVQRYAAPATDCSAGPRQRSSSRLPLGALAAEHLLCCASSAAGRLGLGQVVEALEVHQRVHSGRISSANKCYSP